MAVSEGLTKLSDEVRRLSARAQEAEDRVAAARVKTKADIEADRDATRAVGEQQAQALREKAEEGRDRISNWWADMQRSWDEGVAKMRADVESRKAEHDIHKAQHRADRAEEEARFVAEQGRAINTVNRTWFDFRLRNGVYDPVGIRLE